MNTLSFPQSTRRDACLHAPTVYHIQRRRPVNGTLLRCSGCTVLAEQVQLEGCAHATTIYTPLRCLGPMELVLLHPPFPLASRALYAVKEGGALLLYTPYLGPTTWFGKPCALPIFSCDREAMFRVATELSQAEASQRACDDDVTIKLPRLSRTIRCSRAIG
jgi:hypothetical protein